MSSSLPSFDSLVQDLKHPNPNIKDNACVLLAEHWPDQAMPYFFSKLHDPDPVVYRTAVKALGTLGHRTLPDLLELFQSSVDGTVRACCVKAIVQISVNFPDVSFPLEILSMLEQALDDSSPVVLSHP
jgi:bilin biosynthesis protein